MLIYERYFVGTDESWGTDLGRRLLGPGDLHDLRSISKSVTAALLGIALESDFIPPAPRDPYPSCVAGARACPPEDCGGVPGYAELLDTIRDPDHEDHVEMLEWLVGNFAPDAFDPEAVHVTRPTPAGSWQRRSPGPGRPPALRSPR